MASISLVISAVCAATCAWMVFPSQQQSLALSGAQPLNQFIFSLSSRIDRTAFARIMDQRQLWPELNAELQLWLERHGITLALSSVSHLTPCVVVGAALIGGVITVHPLGCVVGAVATLVWMNVRSEALRRARSQAMIEEMPRLLRSLANALSSGQTLTQAIAYVASQNQGPASEAFARASMRLSCGSSIAEALDELAESLSIPSAQMLVNALMISQRTGSPLHGMLNRSAQLVEQQSEFEQMLLVKTAQVRLSVRVVVALPALMVGFLSLFSNDFRAGLMSMTGMVCLLFAAALDFCGLLVIRRMMKGVLA
ncbi:MAG: type II secretion system F family protein [Atopobiaceae bacterium]|nr:type II secretion system F family protein [Atopobiaceae bacterium]